MQKFYLENMYLKVTINQQGAEVASILSKENGQQYLWNADEKYWKRSSPVLFPIVGSLADGKFTVDGKDYPMSQHGFARDMEFKMIKQPDGKKIIFKLDYNEETMEKYPFPFSLEIEYNLDGYKLTCKWRVTNLDKKPMYFQIGAHPAFMCPLKSKEKQSEYFLNFDTDKELTYSLLSKNGLVEKEGNVLANDGGLVAIDEKMFDNDALIFEGSQVTKVSLCKPDGMQYVTVGFDAPLFGLWSPAGKGAPFICIEPWYGRADKEGFDGDISEREYVNKLAGHSIFEAEYYIEINV
ncbi:Galactose mutarotase [Lachnospiraceae bacterium NE2001]|nr:Galactose mutarotase [Lachnospiraceae bacterium NE2001]